MPPSACPFHALAAENVFRRWDLAVDSWPGLQPAALANTAPKTDAEDDTCGDETDTLTQAAREAWRHSLRCVGRLHWRALQVQDARAARSVDDVFDALCQHLRTATNGGAIRPMMTVFHGWPGAAAAQEHEVRVWNHQLIRYAGYGQVSGRYLGDPANEALTRLAQQLGWRAPATPGRFDVLPLILQVGRRLELRSLPPELVLEVPLRHPRYAWVEQLGLRWHAVPAIADMLLATPSTAYPCAPFNGWYMGTEIGSRNLGDDTRYAQLPVVAAHLGLDTRQSRNLWRDHALLVLNEAVLHSFEQDGVKLVDHHQATAEFEQFCTIEQRHGREVSADWSWIVPPTAASATPVFHRTYPLHPQLPNLLPQVPAWQTPHGQQVLAAYSSRAPEGPPAKNSLLMPSLSVSSNV